MEIIIDDPCPGCLGEDDECGCCHGTGLETRECPEQDEVNEEARGTK